MDRPWYRRFVLDILEGTAELTLAEYGLYNRLLDHQWCRKNGRLPLDLDRLARMVGIARIEFDELWPEVSEKFELDDDGYFNQRLEEERLRAERISASKAENGRKGGQRRRVRSQPESVLPFESRGTDGAEPSKGGEEPPGLQANAKQMLSKPADTRARARRASVALPSTTLGERGEGGPGEEGDAEFDDELDILVYLNDLAGTAYGLGTDTSYIRERLAEGRSAEDCFMVVEAAVCSDRLADMNPRRVFSERWFGQLLSLRMDPSRWGPYEPRLKQVLDDRMEMRQEVGA